MIELHNFRAVHNQPILPINTKIRLRELRSTHFLLEPPKEIAAQLKGVSKDVWNEKRRYMIHDDPITLAFEMYFEKSFLLDEFFADPIRIMPDC